MRVVRLVPEGEELTVKEGGLVDVVADGVEVYVSVFQLGGGRADRLVRGSGEIVFRGNIVMKVPSRSLHRLQETTLMRSEGR